MTSLAETKTDGLNHSSESRLLFLTFFLAAGLILALLAASQVVKYREICKSIALFGAGVLALLSGVVVWFPEQFRVLSSRSRILQYALALVASLWCGWVVLIAYTHHVEGWDEGAYVLSGMALRGYDVPYAAHRAPVTGFLCAVFMGWDRFLNPVLLTLLLVAMYFWVRRLLGPAWAALSLSVLLCQNLLLESTVDIMSELPAALLLLVGFSLLAQEQFWRSSFWLTLVVFARWNLAPVWAVVLTAVLIRFGVRPALKFLAVGLAIFSVWYVITVAMGAPDPLLTVYRGNFLPALAWAPTTEQRPDFLVRVDFYAKHFFFLTPVIFFALIANPVYNLGKHLRTELWTILVVVPLALLAYIVVMLNIGGLFPRFVAPLIPSAAVSMLAGLSRFCNDFSFPASSRVRIITIILFLTCGIGLWPLSAVVQARVNHNALSVFSADLRRDLMALDRKAQLNGVPREPLSSANGDPAMVETRHRILFPSARRTFNGDIIRERDSIEMVRRLAAACHSGDLMLIPKKYAADFQPGAVLFSGGEWALVRNP